MCNYCDGVGLLCTICSECYENSDKVIHDVEYRWDCDKCHGEGLGLITN